MAKVRGSKAVVVPHLTQSPSTTLTQSANITTTKIESVVTSAPAVSPVVQLPQSLTQPLRLSVEEKASPSVSMTSPTSRSPKPRATQQDAGDECEENIEAEIKSSIFFSKSIHSGIITIEDSDSEIEADAAESDLAVVEAVVDDMEALAEESLTSRRGRSAVSSLQSYRGRGRGGRVTRGQARTESESNGKEGGYESEKSEGEGTPRGGGTVSRNIRRGRGSRRIASLSQSGMDEEESPGRSAARCHQLPPASVRGRGRGGRVDHGSCHGGCSKDGVCVLEMDLLYSSPRGRASRNYIRGSSRGLWAGPATGMSPDNNEDWHNRMAMHQAKQADEGAVETAVANIPSADKQDENDESIENIAAEVRRSSIENEERRPSVESKDSDVEVVVDDMEEESPGRLGKPTAKESLTPSRGRSAVSSLQPSPASVREGGRGERVTQGQARTESESNGKEGGNHALDEDSAQHPPSVPMSGYRGAEGGIPMTALVSQGSGEESVEDIKKKMEVMQKQLEEKIKQMEDERQEEKKSMEEERKGMEEERKRIGFVPRSTTAQLVLLVSPVARGFLIGLLR